MDFDHLDSPLGTLLVAMDDEGLAHLDLPHERRPTEVEPTWHRNPPRLAGVARQLDEYFAGKRRVFDLPLSLRGTAFQRAVWQALVAIPYGETTSYAKIARCVGRPRAVRAVGSANGANPVAIIVPCHRVLATGGGLGGYGGGLDAKRLLLALEAGDGSQRTA